MKFIHATCTLYTCSPQGILHRVFSAVGFWLTCHMRSLSSWGIVSTHKYFLTWEPLKCWVSSSGLLSLSSVIIPSRVQAGALGSGCEIPSLISPPSSLGLMVCFIVFGLYWFLPLLWFGHSLFLVLWVILTLRLLTTVFLHSLYPNRGKQKILFHKDKHSDHTGFSPSAILSLLLFSF